MPLQLIYANISGFMKTVEVKLALILILMIVPALPLSGQDILTFEELEKGMTGKGKTVFEGTKVEEFKVEIAGLFENSAGPDRDRILVEVSGDRVEETGVMGGMSGSPIYIDGKLIGALAYTWPFQKRNLAGVTPIKEMLSIPKRIASPKNFSQKETYTFSKFYRDILNPENNSEIKLLEGLNPPENPGTLPLVFSGFDSSVLSNVKSGLKETEFYPVTGSGNTEELNEKKESARIKAGSVLGVQMMRGDMQISAFGTATRVTNNRIYGFGHPFYNLGATEMPLLLGSVETLQPSMVISNKRAKGVKTLGAVTRDSSTGIMGVIDRKADMIPVRVGLSRNGEYSKDFSLEIFDHDLLTPRLLGLALQSIVSSSQQAFGYDTISLDGTFELKNHPNIKISNILTGNNSGRLVASLARSYYKFIYTSGFKVPEVKGVSFHMDYTNRIKAADITGVWFSRDEIEGGEKLPVKIFLKPFRGERREHSIKIKIPQSLKGKKVKVRVGGSFNISSIERTSSEYKPKSLNEVIRLINTIRPTNNIYIMLTTNQPTYLMQGKSLGNIPPTKRDVLGSKKRGQSGGVMKNSVISEDIVNTEYVINGYQELELEVK